jgi:hypothetical protein
VAGEKTRRVLTILRDVSGYEDVWLPLVDEPIGSIVASLQEETPGVDELVNTPRRLLAFRTFAYIRVGILLGQLLVEHDIAPYDGTETWIEALLRDPAHHARVAQEVRAVAEEIANDPKYADDEHLGPDDETRARFRDFARQQLSGLGD